MLCNHYIIDYTYIKIKDIVIAAVLWYNYEAIALGLSISFLMATTMY